MNNPEVIKITPVEDVFSITWNIGKRCNYDCVYCPAMFHDDSSKHLSLTQFKNYWIAIYNKSVDKNLKYKISFTGGEVTTNKNFLPFVEWLKENYASEIHSILVTTNGSASFKYYEKMYLLVDNISFSTHSEFFHEKKFFETMVKLKKILPQNKFIHVNIMDEYWNRDRIVKYKKILEEHQIGYNISEVHPIKASREFPIFKGKLDLEI